MTTPTQAQIEAAAKAMMFPTIAKPSGYWLNKAEAALTAAAQVGDDTISDLTTGGKPTAQVGEPMKQTTEKAIAGIIMDADTPERLRQELENRTYELNHALLDLKEIEGATIERCAQVVEQHDRERGHTLNADIAAAIRKLKDEA